MRPLSSFSKKKVSKGIFLRNDFNVSGKLWDMTKWYVYILWIAWLLEFYAGGIEFWQVSDEFYDWILFDSMILHQNFVREFCVADLKWELND